MVALSAHAAQLKLNPQLFILDDGQRMVGELGRLSLRESTKSSRLIEVAVARLPATTRTRGSPIFYIAGGPGVSGIQSIPNEAKVLRMLQDLGEVIIVDQRGAGESRPLLDCAERWELPLDRVVSLVETRLEAQKKFSACATFWRNQGFDLNAYNSQVYADDIKRVADALAYRRFTLFAFSYGTQIALDIVKRHGNRIDRAVLIGVMGPRDSLRLAQHHERIVNDLALRVRQDPAAYSIYGDLSVLINQALSKVDKEPLELSVEGHKLLIDGDTVRRWAVNKIGRRPDVEQMPLFFYLLAQERLAVPRLQKFLEEIGKEMINNRRGPLNRRSAAQHFITVCASGQSAADRELFILGRNRTSFGQTMHTVLPEACPAWGIRELDDTYRSDLSSERPLLLVSGSFDVRTPLEQAERLTPGLINAQHLIVEHATHTDLLQKIPAVNDAVKEFLAGKSYDKGVRRISLPAPKFVVEF